MGLLNKLTQQGGSNLSQFDGATPPQMLLLYILQQIVVEEEIVENIMILFILE